MTCSYIQAVTANPSVADPAKHVKYNLGMVLGVDDFIQEFTYHNAHRAWLARDLVGYGTIWGLKVLPEDDADKGPRVLVECGAALSPRGQPVHVSPAQCAYLNDWIIANRPALEAVIQPTAAQPATATVYAVLAYDECETDDVPLAGEPCRIEENLVAPSRIKDHFKLQLRLDPPLQTEEDALRNFVRALAQVAVVDPPGTDLTTFETRVRNSQQPLTSPPTPAPNTYTYSFPAGTSIPSDQVGAYLRAAMRIWTVELRPRCRPAWLAEDGVCCAGATQVVHPAEDDYITLAKIGVAVHVDPVNTTPDNKPVWYVASAVADVHVDDRDRPYVLHLRMLQEWLLSGSHPAAGGVVPLVAPSLVGLVAHAPSYGVVAAGLVRADHPAAVGPAVGNLRIASVAAGEVVMTFDEYEEPYPVGDFQYVVKVLAVSAPPRTPVPTVRFLEFRPNGFAIKVTRGNANVSVADLQTVPFMIEVTRIG
jgi:hypothetical protein